MKPSLQQINKIKLGIQGVFMILLGEFAFYGIFRCPFAIPYVSCESCPVIQCPGRSLWLPVWIGILGTAVFFGRAFCGYVCPVGTIADLMALLSPKGVIKKFMGFTLTYTKYIVLIAAVVLIFGMNNPRWAIPIRTGDFFNSVKLTFEHANNLWILRTVFILAAIGVGLVISKFWCRYLCPTGGLLDLANSITIFKYFKTSACNDCDKCTKICDMATRPAEINCTNCSDCRDVCPVEAIKLGREE